MVQGVRVLVERGRLVHLHIEHSELNLQGAIQIAKGLQKPACCLQTLNISRNALGDVGVAPIIHALGSDNVVLHSLDLSENELTSETGALLARVLDGNDTLTTLVLEHNRLGDEGVAALAAMLESELCRVRFLDLSRNKLMDRGALALAKALKTNLALTTLKLSRNKITDKGGAALGKAFRASTSLKTLDLRWNDMTADGKGGEGRRPSLDGAMPGQKRKGSVEGRNPSVGGSQGRKPSVGGRKPSVEAGAVQGRKPSIAGLLT
eukprot:CAMPEP_0206039386 /NCGR_PEP_ID=MMETSP1466-20131121/4723_1 /ASSEMBLY_ACC=CAM_ASM_001126 /TAXON_ID=44452 /ORGANISM="Pavlova gyrans, Strain CCMP608" /LENGTH=263 /DNA_ID=CAMNT_0053414023 /DNA_START=1 /DNA_END=792 /DNA_ORIENTATION=+